MARNTLSGSLRGCTLALLAVAAPARTQATQAPQPRDLWYAYLADGQRWGAHNLQVGALPDGNHRYQLSLRLLIDLLASQQAITVDGDYVVTPELQPVSMRVETTQLSERALVTGRRSGETFTLSFDPPGAGGDRTIALDPGQPVLFWVCVDDWLARLDPATESATAGILDDETWEVETVVATRLRHDETGSEWQLDYGGEQGLHTLTLDPQGTLARAHLGALQQDIVRCTADEAHDLTPLNMDSPEVLAFPLGREVGAPHRLRRLVVKLTWKDIPFESFQLEDARQRLLEHRETSAEQTALLEIAAPAVALDSATIPVDDPAFAPYLAETALLKPNDAQILAAARKVTAGATNAREAVASLSKWVSGYVEAEMIVETLSGPEVLAGRRGKCTEYSTLFASLARAVGIPTRIVLGERMVEDMWMGHMWNEAWVGRWITVDPTVNQIDGSFELLKFTHSDSVQGTLALRFALSESLTISIEDLEQIESDLLGTYATGIDGVTYTNVDYVAQLTAPSGDWTLTDNSRPEAATIRFDPPQGPGAAIHFLAFPMPPDTGAEAFIHSRLGDSRAALGDFEVLSTEPREVQDAQGHAAHARGSLEGHEHPILLTEVAWVRGPIGYLMTLHAARPGHEAWRADFEKLVASFRFLDE